MENNKLAGKPLSARAIETMRPGEKDRADTEENTGLRVSCGSTGARTFFYRYISPETEKLTQMKIGSYPEMSLAQARLELVRLKLLRKSGLCPKAESLRLQQRERDRVAFEQRQKAVASFTVNDLVDIYLTEVIEDRMITTPNSDTRKRVAGARKPKGQAETRRILYGDAVRVLGKKPAAETTRRDVVDMVKGILDRGANVQAGSVLRELSAAYEYAIGLGRFDDDFANPALLAKASLKAARVRLTSVKGKRVLSDKELTLLLAWLPGSGFSATQKSIIRLTLWTGCRSGEVCLAEWVDVDLEKSTWHMRDSKNGAERHVQLPRQAVAFLRQLRLGTETYLFPSTKTGQPLQQKSLTETKWHLKNPDKVKNGSSYRPQQLWLDSIADWSPHDLRRTVRTGLSRLGCRSEVAEAVLGHSRKGIEGTYDLHNYEDECREWLQRWADHLDTLM
ncbi:MAG: tyrosine-type recombinase/integrase [bacterium]|nr:tyrosine-type recombinase/integrase [bacterium]